MALRRTSSAVWLIPALIPCMTQVVAYDYGIKKNILRRLASFGCRITVVPANWPASEVLKMNPDGVFFSNGPVSGLCAAHVRACMCVCVLIQDEP
eukprot:scaffold81456_cov18-Tisochrysis_lutea.AAC.1